jgi:hypothetical protein
MPAVMLLSAPLADRRSPCRALSVVITPVSRQTNFSTRRSINYGRKITLLL